MRAVNIESIELGEVGRLLLMPFCCTGIGDLVVGGFLLSVMRTLERWWGSRRFASFILVSSSLTLLLHVAIFKATGLSSLRLVRPGPSAFIYTLLVRYLSDVPRLHLSDNIFVYASAMWCTLSFGSAQTGVALLAGLLTTSKRLPFRYIEIPKSCSGLFDTLNMVLESKNAPRPPPGEIMASLHGQGAQDGPYRDQLLPGHGDWDFGAFAARGQGPEGATDLRYRGARGTGARQRGVVAAEDEIDDIDFGAFPRGGSSAGIPDVAVSPESLQALVDMGFSEESARAALEQSHGSVEQAVALLAQ